MTQITISKVSDAKVMTGKNKGNDYSTFETNEGNFAVFDKTMIETLKKAYGVSEPIDVTIEQKGDFKNITAIGESTTATVEEPVKEKRTTVGQDPVVQTLGLFTSTTLDMKPNKDEACEIMDLCIELVKQARAAFN